MRVYRAAAVQVCSGPDLRENLAVCEHWIEQAVQSGAELAALPENFAFMGPPEEKVARAPSIHIAAVDFLRTTAKKLKITLLGGGIPVPAQPGRVFNTAVLIDSTGDEAVRYRKMHLFDVRLPTGETHQESATVEPGEELPPLHRHPRLGNLGLSICYDVRFPEIYRHLSAQGAEVLLVPSAFTAYTGQYHWRVLLRARAIENTCYVVAPAQTGRHSERRASYGHSLIVDPWGEVMADAGSEPGLAVADIDPARIEEVRSQLPALRHRRLPS